MWRVLMAVMAGAFLAQVDFDRGTEMGNLGAEATPCSDEVLSVGASASDEVQSVFGGCKCEPCAKGYVCKRGGRCCDVMQVVCCCCQPK